MLRTAALLLVAVGALAGCRGDKPAAAAADGELEAYRREIAPLGEQEREALDALASVTGAGYESDEALLAALRERTLPRYREFVAGLDALRVPGGEIGALHERLRKDAAAELALLQQLEQAVARGDSVEVVRLNAEQRRLDEETDALLTEFHSRAPALATSSKGRP